MRFTLLFMLVLIICSCEPQRTQEPPVAQVFESTLSRSEIIDFIPNGTSSEDSLLMAQNYIRNWVTQKLLLHKAIENLSNEEMNIQKQVEDYRTSLLIYQYKQKLIAQRLMDEISEEDIETYYNKNEKNFILPTPIIKAVFFILPKNAPNLKEVKKWFKSDKANDQESLEDYCLTHFNTLEKEILVVKNIEKEDDDNYYFLKIKEMRHEQTLAPLDYVRDEITLILKNKKKLQFENDLEKQINEEGVRKKYVKIY